MKLILTFSILIFWGCNFNKPSVDSVKLSENSNSRIDSLKWTYYVYNYSKLAIFNDTVPPYKEIRFNPIECDINFDDSSSSGKDSTYYRFSLTKNRYKFGWIEGSIADMLGDFNGNIIPITQHGTLDLIKYPDSVKLHFANLDKQFKEYLRSYKGNFGLWLLKEINRKNIILN